MTKREFAANMLLAKLHLKPNMSCCCILAETFGGKYYKIDRWFFWICCPFRVKFDLFCGKLLDFADLCYWFGELGEGNYSKRIAAIDRFYKWSIRLGLYRFY